MIDVPEPTRLDATALREAAPAAIERAAKEMLEPSLGAYQGIPALRRLSDEIASWPEVAEDWQWCARFLYQVIERRGTGGGNFRRMYARFLGEVGRDEAAIAAEAADRWSALAEAAREASEADDADPGLWRALGKAAADVTESEERLWTALLRPSSG